MFRTLITNAAALVAGVVLTTAFYAAPARAQSVITINNASCTASGPSNALVINCTGNGGGGGSGVPTGCSISGPTTGTVGQGITLTSSCTGGGAATAWSWTGGLCAGSLGQSCAVAETAAGSIQYAVTPSNASGSAAQPSTRTVTWSAGGGGGGGGGGGLAACTAAGYSVVGSGAINLPLTSAQGGNANFGDTQAWVFAFTPSGPDVSNGSITIAENGGVPYSRQGVISTTPCDFGNDHPLGFCNNSSTCSLNFRVRALGGTKIGTATLVQGQTYYFSFRDGSFGSGGSCGPGNNCATIYNYSPPH